MARGYYFGLHLMMIIFRVFGGDGSFDLSAFEYLRRFDNKVLSLGQCPTRFVKYPEINAFKMPCRLPEKSGEKVFRDKVVDSQKVVTISTASELLLYVGMCDERSAAYFRLLADGDCIAVQIAEKLSFTSQYATRLFMKYFRPRVHVLYASVPNLLESYSVHYNNKYYTDYIGIGTEEVLIVQMKFHLELEAIKAQRIDLDSTLLSEHVMYIIKYVGLPIKIKIVQFSTSDMDFKTHVFKDQNIENCISYIEKCEQRISQAHQELLLGRRNTHLKYGFMAFEIVPTTLPVDIDTLAEEKRFWQDVALLQIDANRGYATNKRIRDACRLLKQEYTSFEPVRRFCLLAKRIVKELKRLSTSIQIQRCDWSTITPEQQINFIKQGWIDLELLRTKLKEIRKGLREALTRAIYKSYINFK